MSVFDSAFRLIASPMLIGQALQVRRIAQSLPEAAGPRSGVEGSGPQLRLAIIGDSSAAGVGVTTQAEALAGQLTQALARTLQVDWHLDAITGATTRSTLARLQSAQPMKRDVVIIVLGVNDATRLTPATRWVRLQETLLARTKALHNQSLTLFTAMPPLGAFPLLPNPLRWTLGRHAEKMEARRLRWLNGRDDCMHLPFELEDDPALMAPDGFHPSAKLYTIWGEMLASRINAHWPAN